MNHPTCINKGILRHFHNVCIVQRLHKTPLFITLQLSSKTIASNFHKPIGSKTCVTVRSITRFDGILSPNIASMLILEQELVGFRLLRQTQHISFCSWNWPIIVSTGLDHTSDIQFLTSKPPRESCVFYIFCYLCAGFFLIYAAV